MGALHARVCHRMDQVQLVGIVDIEPEKAQKLADQYDCRVFDHPDQLLDCVDAVTIAVPTEAHAAVAEPFLRRAIPVLVEKPLAASLDEARQLLQLAQTHHCPLQVGYSERFNPIVQAMARLNIQPRFIEAQRISPYTFRSTDVGVVLDLMIHDIDIMLSLAHGAVIDLQAAGVNVIGQHEDIANVRLAFDNGCVANLTASRLALKTERKIRVFSDQAYLSLDYLKKTGTMVTKTANIDMVEWLRQQNAADNDVGSLNWLELVNVQMLNIDDREPLELEQEAFVKAVLEGSQPQVSAEDAIAAMELAERIVAKIRQSPWQSPGHTITAAPPVASAESRSSTASNRE